MRRQPGFALLALVAAGCATWCSSASAEQHFLGNQTAGTNSYLAYAKIGVDIPETYSTVTDSFVFDGDIDFYFEVRGTITIYRSGPIGAFVDPITSVNYPTAGVGFNNMKMEIVSLFNITSITATATPNVNPNVNSNAVVDDVQVGDGATGYVNNGPLFSTGGAIETLPDGSLADGFLNLFVNIDISEPDIPIPAGLQAFGLDASYEVENLFNKTVLHLEANPDIFEFPPRDHPFFQTAAAVDFFAPASHQLVQDLSNLPAPIARSASDMVFARFLYTEIRVIPEPASMALAGVALAGLSWAAVRRRSTPRR